MARLVYFTNISFDGYAADANGRFDWSEPDEEVHAFINDVVRSAGTWHFGRRNYEVMTYWDAPPPDSDPISEDFAAIWRAADKVVYSTTLESTPAPRTRLVRSFDLETIAEEKATASADLLIGGPTLAGQAIRAGLVDDFHVMVSPVLVGGGLRAWPEDVRLDLDLVDEHRFASGIVHLHYRQAAR